MAVGLRVLKIDRGQRSDGSGHNEGDYNSLKIQFRSIIEIKCILNGLFGGGLCSPSASRMILMSSVLIYEKIHMATDTAHSWPHCP